MRHGRPRPRPAFRAGLEAMERRVVLSASPYAQGSAGAYLHANFVARSQEDPNVIFFGDSLTSWFGEGSSAQTPWSLPGPEQFVPHASGELPGPGTPDIWQQRIAGFRAFNFGVPGDTAADLLWRIENGELADPPGPLPAGQPTPTLAPKAVVLLIGLNDIAASSPADLASGAAAERTFAAIRAVIDEIHAQSPATKILDMDLFPTGLADLVQPIRQVNARLDALAAAPGYGYLRTMDLSGPLSDLSGDGMSNPLLYFPDVGFNPNFVRGMFHLNPDGYEVWASAVQAPLRRMLGLAAQPQGGVGAELGVYDRKSATFVVDQSSPAGRLLQRVGSPTRETVNALAQPFGNAADDNAPVVGDYDGDGIPDLGVFDRTTATFILARSGGGPPIVARLGNPAHDNIPVVGDYNGDGHADLAIYDATAAAFLVVPSGGGPLLTWPLGNPAHQDVPLAVDYAGSGRTELALFDRTTSTFIVEPPAGGVPTALQLGNPAHHNIPLTGDYDGDGRTDYGYFDPTTATFVVIPSGGGPALIRQFGDPRHAVVPITGDYDGDGRTDFAIDDRTTSTLMVQLSGGGPAIVRQFGNPADPIVPLSSPLGAEVLDPPPAPAKTGSKPPRPRA